MDRVLQDSAETSDEESVVEEAMRAVPDTSTGSEAIPERQTKAELVPKRPTRAEAIFKKPVEAEAILQSGNNAGDKAMLQPSSRIIRNSWTTVQPLASCAWLHICTSRRLEAPFAKSATQEVLAVEKQEAVAMLLDQRIPAMAMRSCSSDIGLGVGLSETRNRKRRVSV